MIVKDMSDVKKNILDDLKMCDTIIEVIDARVAFSSRNKEMVRYLKDKNRVLVINKCDLINEADITKLENTLKKEYRYVLGVSAKSGKSIKRLLHILGEIYSFKQKRYAKKGINALPIKVMLTGIPNVGKSKLINILTGRNIAPVADKPGFTRGKKWIKILPNVELLDTPGVFWISGKDNERKKLTIVGAIKEDQETTREALFHFMEIVSKSILEVSYMIKIPSKDSESAIIFLMNHFKLSEHELGRKILTDFRDGKLGKIVLEI